MSELKSDNIWDYKPWWCQPWSILLTGVVIITGSWLLLKVIWITVAVSVPIILWWVYFLVIFPQMFKNAILQNPDLEL